MCSVGGGSGANDGQLHGMGCLLTSDYVLTARHVWTTIQDRYRWPVVLKHDGLFRCQIVFESEVQDLLFVRAIERVGESSARPPPSEYPSYSDRRMFIGDEVGFISRLMVPDTVESATQYTCFSHGYVSFMLRDSGEGTRFAISSTLIQEGFSGSPVFYQDSSLAGVLVQTISFRPDFHNPRAPLYTLPVVSPIDTVMEQISAIK